MIGTRAVSSRARRRRHSSMPEISGSIQSSRIRSGRLLLDGVLGLVAGLGGDERGSPPLRGCSAAGGRYRLRLRRRGWSRAYGRGSRRVLGAMVRCRVAPPPPEASSPRNRSAGSDLPFRKRVGARSRGRWRTVVGRLQRFCGLRLDLRALQLLHVGGELLAGLPGSRRARRCWSRGRRCVRGSWRRTAGACRCVMLRGSSSM
jgi:hypothetical protein